MTGIYVIRNRFTGKKYVGESVDIKRRWAEHKRELANGSHHCWRLQKDYNRYGRHAFSFRVVERFYFTKGANKDKLKIALLLREGYYMDLFNSLLDYNTEDSIGDLKKLADGGRSKQKFARYRRYRRFIRTHIGYAKHWRPHIMVATLYNPFIKAVLITAVVAAIYYVISGKQSTIESILLQVKELLKTWQTSVTDASAN